MTPETYAALPDWLQVILFLWLARDIHSLVKDHEKRLTKLESESANDKP